MLIKLLHPSETSLIFMSTYECTTIVLDFFLYKLNEENRKHSITSKTKELNVQKCFN